MSIIQITFECFDQDWENVDQRRLEFDVSLDQFQTAFYQQLLEFKLVHQCCDFIQITALIDSIPEFVFSLDTKWNQSNQVRCTAEMYIKNPRNHKYCVYMHKYNHDTITYVTPDFACEVVSREMLLDVKQLISQLHILK